MSNRSRPLAIGGSRPVAVRRGNKSTLVVVVILILVLVVAPICTCGGCIAAGLWGVSSVMTSSEPYQHGLERAQANAEVIEQLGEPIEAGMLFSGNIEITNDRGHCDMTIPISGPKGSGSLIVRGKRERGQWQYDEISVQIGSRNIDLQQ